jgi:predicted dehydrogenase
MKNKNKLSSSPGKGLTRRHFLTRTTLAAGAAAMYFPYVGRVLGANDRINVACIGVGGKGNQDSFDAAANGANIVAICDVDRNNLQAKINEFGTDFPTLKPGVFKDYRDMFDKIGKDIDAVTISIPDHQHGVAAARALKMGKHVFCQKPLVQTVNEARIVRKLARDNKLATQMGNQGSAEPGLRRAVEVIQAGVIGAPLELHVWSNRPIWPQGLDRPPGSDPVPSTLDWDLWLGPAKPRPYLDVYDDSVYAMLSRHVYHNFSWRGWTEFGTGALGDMACHTVNMPFRAMKLGYPNVVECEQTSAIHPEMYPKTSRIRFEFPEREGLPPVKFWWYDGNPKEVGVTPFRPDSHDVIKEIIALQDELPVSGALIIGEKGKIFSPDDYGTKFFIAMKGQDTFIPGDQHEAAKSVPITLPRVEGPGSITQKHMSEWFKMMKDGTPSYSNFEIAGYLAEVILLGCVALRCGVGKRMEWDGPNMTSPNLKEAANFVKRENRAGWEA